MLLGTVSPHKMTSFPSTHRLEELLVLKTKNRGKKYQEVEEAKSDFAAA